MRSQSHSRSAGNYGERLPPGTPPLTTENLLEDTDGLLCMSPQASVSQWEEGSNPPATSRCGQPAALVFFVFAYVPTHLMTSSHSKGSKTNG